MNDVVLQEPLGALVYLVQQVVRVASDRDDEIDARSLAQVTDVLDKLVAAMNRCSLENFDLVNVNFIFSHMFLNYVPYLQGILITLFRMKKYEALMCYTINTWSLGTPEQGGKLLALHKCYTRLVDFAKVSTYLLFYFIPCLKV